MALVAEHPVRGVALAQGSSIARNCRAEAVRRAGWYMAETGCTASRSSSSKTR